MVFGLNKTTVDKITRAQSSASVYVSSPSDYFLINETYNSLYAYKYGGTVNGYPYILDENGIDRIYNSLVIFIKDIEIKELDQIQKNNFSVIA